MLSYGGVYLDPPTAAVFARVEYLLATSPPEADPADGNQALRDRVRYAHPGPLPPAATVLGRLTWPTGASRFACAHLLATRSQLDAIRGQVYDPKVAGKYRSLALALDDGAGGSITTKMWMLPARPLCQATGKGDGGLEDLSLLTLVDDRYWWWLKAADVTLTAGTTTWAQLLASVGTALGVTMAADAIDAAYLKPPAELASHYDYLPPLLDAAARSVGQRIVRTLGGSVLSQSPVAAKAAQDARAAKYPKEWGGTLALLPGD